MDYRMGARVKPLILVETTIENQTKSKIEYLIKAKAQFKSKSTANNVEILIPVPSDVDSPSFKTNIGSV
jgi:AP-1 complex subunit mu